MPSRASETAGILPLDGEDQACRAPDPRRTALETAWLDLTRRTLPGLAVARGWPVRADHCFQRILLDNACNGRWYDHIAGRPAYAKASASVLCRAVGLAEAVVSGTADLAAMNRRSLAWRKTGARSD